MTTNSYITSDLISLGILEIGDGYRAKNEELGKSGIPFARAGNINNGFHFAEADLLAEENIPRAGSKVSKSGDVVFTSKGTVGRFAFVRGNIQQFVYSPQLCYWRSRSVGHIDPQWMFYWMYGEEFQAQMNRVKGQTDMAEYVSLQDQRRMQMTCPAIAEQRAIAHVLGALDDKIELNRRMNATLEEMAQTLFRSWFVDFDPVRAKAEGRKSEGMDAETAALFPSALAESELGLIPQGWKVKPVDECVSIYGGGTPSTSDPNYWEGGEIHWVTPKDLSPLVSPVLLDTERKITEQGLGRISSGLLPVGTLLMSSRAPIGYLAISEIPVAINQGFIGMVCDKGMPNYYLLNWARQSMDAIVGRANGSTFLEISKTAFRPLPVLVPTEALLARFVELVASIYRQIVTNLRESNRLIVMRDELLPKLISGEIRLPEAMVAEFSEVKP